ncbi:unnamed protein product [Linum tenue]|uniref:CCHC-type domain-containing protein n=3 Tax=Linum tenue TaxID=586396 RepID=A0AAV0H4Z4_9ROSI|nr:unnamed protein product [Linum tenue]
MVSADFKTRICAPWQRALVVRLLGLKLRFSTLCARLQGLWKPAGSMEVKDLDHGCVLVKFSNEQDYFRALTDGPWMIFDHYLVVQQWSPKFKVSDPLPKTMIVWVQLPGLKIHFYHKEVLTTLGNLIGRTIKLDYHTLNQQRAKFARLAIEVDLGKHLVPWIWLDDAWQKVEYEKLPAICFECGIIGHVEEKCPEKFPSLPPATLTTSDIAIPVAVAAGSMKEPNPGFEPWLLVPRKSRRTQRDGDRKGKIAGNSRIFASGNQINSVNKVTNGRGTSPFRERGIFASSTPMSKLLIQERNTSNGKKIGDEGETKA